MNSKSITSVSYILIGNMLTIYSSIGDGLTAKLTAVLGLILFFIGLIQFKDYLDVKGASGVNKLIWAAILGIIANLLTFIPLVGIIPAGICNIIAFFLQLIGLINLKSSEKIGKAGAGGVNLLLVALTLMVLASIFNIVPFVGGTIKTVIAFIAFILIPFGWVKIQGAIADHLLEPEMIIETKRKVEYRDWFYENRIVIVSIEAILIIFCIVYFLIFKHSL